MLVTRHSTIRRHNPEDFDQNLHHHGNLKSRIVYSCFFLCLTIDNFVHRITGTKSHVSVAGNHSDSVPQALSPSTDHPEHPEVVTVTVTPRHGFRCSFRLSVRCYNVRVIQPSCLSFVTHVHGYYANGSSVQDISTLKTMGRIHEFHYILGTLKNCSIPGRSVFIYLRLSRPSICHLQISFNVSENSFDVSKHERSSFCLSVFLSSLLLVLRLFP